MGYLEPKEWEKLVAEPKETGLRSVYKTLFPDFSVKRPPGLPPPRSFNEIQAEKRARFSFLKNEFARRQLRKGLFEHPIYGEAMLYDPAHERWIYMQAKHAEMFGRMTRKSAAAIALMLLPIPVLGYQVYKNTKARFIRYDCGYRTDLNVYRFHDMYVGC